MLPLNPILEDISPEDMQLMESIFDLWKKRPVPKKFEPSNPVKPTKSPIDDDLPNTTRIDLDQFKGNEDLISFIAFMSNLKNIQKIKNKKQIIVLFRKYRELLDVLMIAFPYIKHKSREFGMVIPKLVESKDMRSKIKRVFTK
jgi:hypothetical protein